MLSYKIPATVTLLKSKLEVAQTSLDNTIEDLDSEGATDGHGSEHRSGYQWDGKRRRELREAGKH